MTPASTCVHEPGPGDCPTPACYRRLPCPGADEAWGLGKYTVDKAEARFIGALVSDLKYATHDQDTSRMLAQLSEQIGRFLAMKGQNRFDGCAVVPGSRDTELSIMVSVARALHAAGWVGKQETLIKTGQVPRMKSLARSARAGAVADKYAVGAPSALLDCARILVLDDIYDSGATLSEAVAAVRRAAPQAQVVAITAVYRYDPRGD